jgi:chromosome segregation ATPase
VSIPRSYVSQWQLKLTAALASHEQLTAAGDKRLTSQRALAAQSEARVAEYEQKLEKLKTDHETAVLTHKAALDALDSQSSAKIAALTAQVAALMKQKTDALMTVDTLKAAELATAAKYSEEKMRYTNEVTAAHGKQGSALQSAYARVKELETNVAMKVMKNNELALERKKNEERCVYKYVCICVCLRVIGVSKFVTWSRIHTHTHRIAALERTLAGLRGELQATISEHQRKLNEQALEHKTAMQTQVEGGNRAMGARILELETELKAFAVQVSELRTVRDKLQASVSKWTAEREGLNKLREANDGAEKEKRVKAQAKVSELQMQLDKAWNGEKAALSAVNGLKQELKQARSALLAAEKKTKSVSVDTNSSAYADVLEQKMKMEALLREVIEKGRLAEMTTLETLGKMNVLEAKYRSDLGMQIDHVKKLQSNVNRLTEQMKVCSCGASGQ